MWLLCGVEAVALPLNFYFVFCAYLRRLTVAIAPKLFTAETFLIVALVATGLFAAVSVVQVVLYARGRGWFRPVLMVENGALIVMGLLWFLHSVLGKGEPNVFATWGGLLLPCVTLFPLLWPLMTFRPIPPGGGAR
jgi:hypothetical protein